MLVGGRRRDFPGCIAKFGEMGVSGVERVLVRRIIVVNKSFSNSLFSLELDRVRNRVVGDNIIPLSRLNQAIQYLMITTHRHPVMQNDEHNSRPSRSVWEPLADTDEEVGMSTARIIQNLSAL